MTTAASGPRPPVSRADAKGPWGGDGGGGGGGGSGPRNPWSVPPGGRRGSPKPSALDEFLRRTRGGIGAGGPGGGGPAGGGGRPGARTLWGIGAGLLVLLWIAVTSIHPIGPREQGVVTWFGRYSYTLDPGIGLTLPVPIAGVRQVDVQTIRLDNFPATETENLMLTGDQNVVDLAYSLRWQVASAPRYLFRLRNPQQTVRDAAESAMRAVMATTSFAAATGGGRQAVEARVADLTQRILDGYDSGVRVQGVSIRQASAPARIIEEFNAVTAAQQEAAGNLNLAHLYASQVIARAQGEAAQFGKIYEQYKLAPEVTRRRLYYETMESVLARTDKTLVEVPGVTPYLPLGAARPPAPAADATATPNGGGR